MESMNSGERRWEELKTRQAELEARFSRLFQYAPEELDRIFKSRAEVLARREEQQADTGEPHLICALGEEICALPLAFVVKVLTVERYTRVPADLPAVEGVINFQNEIIPVISLRKVLQLAESAPARKAAVILSHAGALLALEMERVVELLNLDEEAGTPARKHPAIRRVHPYGPRAVAVLDIPALFQIIHQSTREA